MSDPVQAAIKSLSLALAAIDEEDYKLADDCIRDVLDQLTGWTGNPEMRLAAVPKRIYKCPGYPNCRCLGKSQWSTKEDPHGTFGAPGGMGG